MSTTHILSAPQFNWRFKDLTGQVFGRLTVLECIGVNSDGRAFWKCKCECSSIVEAMGRLLRNGHVTSCGCAKMDALLERNTTHGMTHTKEYACWANMIQRCENPNNTCWKDYGGRGITVCPRWRNSFEDFYSDMGDAPSSEHTIERRNNSLGYSPRNCIWAIAEVQANNKRSNHIITVDGEEMTIAQASRRYGVNYQCLHYRIKDAKWDVERAVKTQSRAS